MGVVFSALVLTGVSSAASAPVTRGELDRLLRSDVRGWRFRLGEVPGAHAVAFDDTDWRFVDVGHKWWPSDSTCWFRTRITMPERINDVDVSGATIRLRLSIDNEAQAYVDGVLRQQFTRADGDIVLTEDARSGQTFSVALHGINRRGYGRLAEAYLVSSASEEMVAALRTMLKDVDIVTSDASYVPPEHARHWEQLARQAYGAIDLAAYRAGRSAAFLESLKRSRARFLSDAGEFENSLRRIEAKLAKLKKLLKQGRAAGSQLAYRRAEARVVERFLQYARDDMADEALTYKVRALKIATFLDGLCDDALRATAAALENPDLDLRVPTYRTGEIEVRDGAFRQEGRPVFFTGVGHFGQVRRDAPVLADFGLNIIQFEIGPSGVVTGPDKVNRDAIRKTVIQTLDSAAEHHVAVNLLISPHYFPGWAIERNPELAKCGHGFIRYCIEAPDACAIIEKFLRTLMPMIVNHPALHSICLSNEPQYSGKCRYAREEFRTWLKAKHVTIAALNAAHGTSFNGFADVPIPADASNHASYYDWCRFNQERFLTFHAFERDIIREYDPDLPVHAKIQAHDYLDPSYFELGLDYETFNSLGSISGNDCVQIFMGDEEGGYLQDWLRMAPSYTLQRSTAPANPIFNSEDHVIGDGDGRFVPASHIRTAFWTQALHGQGASTTWVWDRSRDPSMSECILTRPNCVVAIGRIGLDLNRLGREVVALQRAKAEAAILYSHASLPLRGVYDREAGTAFEGAYFTDAVWNFVTERQAVAGKLKDYKVVVVPRAPHAPDAVVKAFGEYIESGGTVVTVSDCFTHDEYGRSRGTGLEPSGKGRLVVYPDPLTARAYRDILNGVLDRAGVDRPIRIVDTHGEPVWGVNLRAVQQGGKLVVSLVNFLRRAQTIRFATTPPVASIVNLFDNTQITLPVTLPPLEPALLVIDFATP